MQYVMNFLTGIGNHWITMFLFIVFIFAPEVDFKGLKINGILALLMDKVIRPVPNSEILGKVIDYAEKYTMMRDTLLSDQLGYVEAQTSEIEKRQMDAYAAAVYSILETKGIDPETVRSTDYYKDYNRIIKLTLRSILDSCKDFIMHLNIQSQREEQEFRIRLEKESNGISRKRYDELNLQMNEITVEFGLKVNEKVESIFSEASLILDREYPTENYLIGREALRKFNEDIEPIIGATISDALYQARKYKISFIEQRHEFNKSFKV